MITIGKGAIVRVDVGNQFGKVERELALGLNRSDVPRAGIFFFWSPGIVAVQLDDDYVVLRDVRADSVAPVAAPRVIVAVLCLHGNIVPLAVTVEPIDHRIALAGLSIIAGKEDAEVPRLAQDFTLVSSIRNQSLGRMSSGDDDQKKNSGGSALHFLSWPRARIK